MLTVSYNLNRFGANKQDKKEPAQPMMLFK
jgi:hypothetical protein